ncbi:MAG: Do family serine endopeptidase [Candidatus Cloacimonetes bacterium]|nr:Do family serine endopeptidase [Candidatus Cloacimonadota bacterium]
MRNNILKFIMLSVVLIVLSMCFSPLGATNPKSPFVDIVKDVRESVVNIQVEGEQRITQNQLPFNDEFFKYFFSPREFNRPFTSMGSGFIFKRENNDVYILTNNHVVEGGNDGVITVTLADKEKLKAEIVGLDPETDLAVIKINVSNNTEVVVAELGESDNLEIGEWAIAIGNPFGQLGLQRTVTVGVISAIGRSGLNFGNNSPLFQDYIQTDAAINPGNSGGPLLDINGKVIGVNAAITTTSGGNVGIGFAIPISLAKKVAEDFLAYGEVKRAYLGIMPQEISQELSLSLGLDEISGVLVSKVEKDTPAEEAGIEVGDVILEFNNEKIENVSRFRIVVANSPVNQKINIKVNRNGKIRNLSVILKERESEKSVEISKTSSSSYNLGLRLETLGSDLARRMNIEAESGLIVVQVTPNSPAAKAELRPGDVIVEINRITVNSVKDYEDAVSKAEKDELKVILLYVQGRDGSFKFVPISID